MDAMRKQLDMLMGANRNGDVREVNHIHKYYDLDVCRHYLAGLCPRELFQITVINIFISSFFSIFIGFSLDSDRNHKKDKEE